MERKKHSRREDFVPVRLKKSDISKIVAIFRAESAGHGPTIWADSFQDDRCHFQAVEELLDAEEHYKLITLEAPALTITVSIDAWSVAVVLGRTDTTGQGVMGQLKQIIASRNVWLTPMTGVVCAGFGLGIGIALLAIRSGFFAQLSYVSLSAVSVFALSLAAIGGWIVARINERLRAGAIRFRNEKRRPIDARAAGWDVVKVLIGVAAGAFLQWLRTR